jgi:hypothetical protein
MIRDVAYLVYEIEDAISKIFPWFRHRPSP